MNPARRRACRVLDAIHRLRVRQERRDTASIARESRLDPAVVASELARLADRGRFRLSPWDGRTWTDRLLDPIYPRRNALAA